MINYFRPETIEEALELKAARELQVLAGGTDVYPIRTTREAWGETGHSDVLDITRLADLRRIEDQGGHIRIGCLVTWTDIINAVLPAAFDALKLAAREVGGIQIQNRGTIVGNICNASPAADGTPCLLAMDAEVELSCASERRVVPLAEFHDGYRSTICRPDEIVTAILIPRLPGEAVSHFLKLGARRYLVISIAMAAGILVPDDAGRVADARVAVGSCSATAARLGDLERALVGCPLDGTLAEVVEDGHLAPLSPIDDVRATGDYRQAAARSLVQDLLLGLVSRSQGRSV